MGTLEWGRIGLIFGPAVEQPHRDREHALARDLAPITVHTVRLSEELPRTAARGRRADDPLDRLTPCEREVLGLMAEGRLNAANRALARRDGARDRQARDSIFAKLGLSAVSGGHRRVRAVLTYLDGGR